MSVLPILTPADIQKFDDSLPDDVVQDMINTVAARVVKMCPALRLPLDDPANPLADDVSSEVLKDVMRAAVLRWAERGSGAVREQGSGDFSQSLVVDRAGLFRPNEIRDIADVCGNARAHAQTASTILTGAPTAYQLPSAHPFLIAD